MKKAEKYLNPPLIQVASTLWWHVENSNNFEKSKFILGILYPELIEKYGSIEILPISKSKPFHSLLLLNQEKQYILEIAPDELKFSSVDENYNWDEFVTHVQFFNTLVINQLSSLVDLEHIHAKLEYIDFFEYNYSDKESNISEYLNSHLNIKIHSNIFNRIKNINLNLTDQIDGFGKTSMELNLGDISKEKKGFIVHLINDSLKLELKKETLNDWFNESHSISKVNFEKLISGPLKEKLQYAT